MKSLKLMILVALVLVVSTAVQAGTARLQVIHNAADPAADMVDIYVNGDLFLNDFAFRAATPFVDVPSNVQLNIAVAPGTSASVDDALATFPVTLDDGRTYVAIASGVLDPGGFADNPDGLNIGFNIFARGNIRESARWRWFTDLMIFHGATDAPAVDVRIRNWKWGPLVRDLSYGEFSGYRTVYPYDYTLDITPAGDKNTVVASFEADLSGLRGGAAVVFASGFLDPTANQSGAAFGLFAALPDGTVIELASNMPMQMARLQVIHNAADPAAEVVDIYVNGALFQDDFAFRTATPFVDVPSGVNLNIGVAPGTSGSSDDVIAEFDVMLDAGKTYVAIANGVLNPSEFAANPEGMPIAFTLFPRDDIREKSRWRYLVNLIAFHGATDAPSVDIIAQGGWFSRPLFSDLGYGEFSNYRYMFPHRVRLDVTLAGDRSTVVESFMADLSGLRGGAAIVFASGFLDPDANRFGPRFGLFAALPNGQVVELPSLNPKARLQVIHNAADPAAEEVDVYVNGGLLLDNFAFRTATPYIDVPAETELQIGVAPAASTSAADIIATIPVTLERNNKYVAVANGVLDPGGFEANPDGRSIGFTLFARGDAREIGANGNDMVDFFALHGATDAPTVDVIARDVATLVDNAAYGDVTEYISVPAASYMLDVTPGDDNGTVVASFEADLSGLGGGAAVVFASGFLSPGNDQDGAPFGLFAALQNGTVVQLPAVSPGAVARLGDDGLIPERFELAQNYPNPFNPTTTISYSLPTASNVSLKVYNLLGQEVSTLVDGPREAGTYQVEYDASALASGVYFYRIATDTNIDTRKMVLVK